MAKKLSQPVKKSSAKAKAKGARKVMASGCAKPAWKRGAKAAQIAKRVCGQTGEARRKDYPRRENAGGEANGAYGVVPVDEETGA
jgi:hypothetical protein